MNAMFWVLLWGAFFATMITVGLTDGGRPSTEKATAERGAQAERR